MLPWPVVGLSRRADDSHKRRKPEYIQVMIVCDRIPFEIDIIARHFNRLGFGVLWRLRPEISCCLKYETYTINVAVGLLAHSTPYIKFFTCLRW
jgi:hypothetical protein